MQSWIHSTESKLYIQRINIVKLYINMCYLIVYISITIRIDYTVRMLTLPSEYQWVNLVR